MGRLVRRIENNQFKSRYYVQINIRQGKITLMLLVFLVGRYCFWELAISLVSATERRASMKVVTIT